MLRTGGFPVQTPVWTEHGRCSGRRGRFHAHLKSIANIPLSHVKRLKCSLMSTYELETHPKGAPCLQPTAGIGSSTLPLTLNEIQHRLNVANLKNIVCLCSSHMFYCANILVISEDI